jgi:hypothetical protein
LPLSIGAVLDQQLVLDEIRGRPPLCRRVDPRVVTDPDVVVDHGVASDV